MRRLYILFHNYLCIYKYIHTNLGLYVVLDLNMRFDAFSGNDADSNGESVLRKKWSKETNFVFMDKAPGGWSAWGQPCDAVHAEFRGLLSQSTYIFRCVYSLQTIYSCDMYLFA